MAAGRDVIIGVDLGGTSLRALVLDGRNRILAIEKIPTRVHNPAAGLIRDIAASARRAAAAAEIPWARVRAVSIGLMD